MIEVPSGKKAIGTRSVKKFKMAKTLGIVAQTSTQGRGIDVRSSFATVVIIVNK